MVIGGASVENLVMGAGSVTTRTKTPRTNEAHRREAEPRPAERDGNCMEMPTRGPNAADQVHIEWRENT